MKKTMFAFGVAASLFLVSCGGGETPATDDNATDTTATAETPVADEPVADEPAAAEVSIVGEWQMTDMNLGMELPPEQAEQMAAAIKEMAAGTKYTFNEDGTLTMVSPELGEQSGTYEVVDGDMGKELKVTSAEGKEETSMITELTANSLLLTMNIDGNVGSMTFSR